jgi:hypothetical protein
MSFLIFNT